MIRFLGPSASFCDGLSRREMLRFGGLSMAGVSLPQLVTANASNRTTSSSGSFGKAKNCIVLFLSG